MCEGDAVKVKECVVQLFWSTVPGNYVTTTK